jgi:hypothetical protein
LSPRRLGWGRGLGLSDGSCLPGGAIRPQRSPQALVEVELFRAPAGGNLAAVSGSRRRVSGAATPITTDTNAPASRLMSGVELGELVRGGKVIAVNVPQVVAFGSSQAGEEIISVDPAWAAERRSWRASRVMASVARATAPAMAVISAGAGLGRLAAGVRS